MSSPTKHILLSTIYEEILKEVGDLQNIEPYPFTVRGRLAKVHTSGPEQIDIFYEEVSGYIDMSSIPPVYNPENNKIVSFTFDVNGVQTQFKKSNYKELIRILRTVAEFFKEVSPSILREYGDSTIFIIASQSKTSGEFLTDSQKDAIYYQILIKNLPNSFRINQLDLKILSGASKKAVVFQKIK